MKFYTFLIGLFFTSICFSQEKLPYEVKEYYENGQIKSYNTFWDYDKWLGNTDGKSQYVSTPKSPHGIYLEWYENGEIKNVGVKEKRLKTTFTKDGDLYKFNDALTQETPLKSTTKEKIRLNKDENGHYYLNNRKFTGSAKLVSDDAFQNTKTGIFIMDYTEGSDRKNTEEHASSLNKLVIINGLPIVKIDYFNKKSIKEIAYYKGSYRGSGCLTALSSYFENGQEKSRGTYFKDCYPLNMITRFENGNLAQITNNAYEGMSWGLQQWYSNGQMKYKESINPIGPNVLVYGAYKKRPLHVVMEWYENGNLKRKSSELLEVYPQYYDADATALKYNLPTNTSEGSSYHGLYSYWYASGQLKLQGKYFKNKKVGEWVSYLENGEVDKKEYFKEVSSLFLDDRIYKIDAKGGLNIRNKPGTDGQKVGAIAFEDHVMVVAKTGIKLTINDTDSTTGETKKISGEWVEIKTLKGNTPSISGYVFDGFITRN